MTDHPEHPVYTLEDLLGVVTASLFDETSPADIARLEQLVCNDDRVCELYVQAIFDSLVLRKWSSVDAQDVAIDTCREVHVDRFDDSKPVVAPAPLLPFLSNTLPGVVGSFSSGWPAAYLIATVIFGIGLLIGSLVPVSQPVQVARPSSMPNRMDAEPKVELVGRITGMVDCKWAGTAFDSPGVPLGRKYELASGVMEITYDTGAKVILQGPVTYEVESAAGGYLAAGRLTGKATTETARGLMVRTPTAIVTDLGTEFGVEVSKEGYTISHVFRGSVKLQMVAIDGKPEGNAQVLHENESARVERSGAKQGGGKCVIVFGPSVRPAGFVREIPKRTVKVLDLVDVVAGGDGFSGRRGRGIDPNSGRSTNALLHQYLVSDGQYHRAVGLPLVDGVFIPGGRNGPIQIDSARHTFADFLEMENTDNRTIWGVWAAGGATTHSPPSGRANMPTKASEDFAYKYEMNCLPSDVSHIDADGNGQPDFVARGAVSVSDGILTLTNGLFRADAPTTIWPGKFFVAKGYTIEARVKVVSSSQSGPFAIVAALPASQGDFSAWLNVGDNELTWGPSVDLVNFVCNTKDDYHVYRVAQEPGRNTYSVWRDGVLVRSELPNGADTGGLNRMAFGYAGEFWGGTALVDYVRFTPGAYAPPPPSGPTSDEVPNSNFGSVSAKLGGIDYASSGHGALLLHANMGITFDLEAIRRANRGHKLSQFRAVAGNAEMATMRGEAVWADFWVFVDGQPRFRRREINGTNGAMPVNVPLSETDRFLTLAATDGGNGMRWDVILFGDPQLELK